MWRSWKCLTSLTNLSQSTCVDLPSLGNHSLDEAIFRTIQTSKVYRFKIFSILPTKEPLFSPLLTLLALQRVPTCPHVHFALA